MSFTPLIAIFLAAGAIAAAPGSGADGPAPSLALHADGPYLTADAPGASSIAWDLDGDGQLDDAAGPTATARPGAHHVRAQAQWLTGAVPIERSATRAVTAP